MPESLDYRSPTTTPARRRRSLTTWMLLLGVWFVGLAVWVFYFAVAAVVLLNVL